MKSRLVRSILVTLLLIVCVSIPFSFCVLSIVGVVQGNAEAILEFLQPYIDIIGWGILGCIVFLLFILVYHIHKE